MARIKTYNKDNEITGSEKLIGSDVDGSTLNYEINDIRDYIGGVSSIQDKIVSGGATWHQLLQYKTTQIIGIVDSTVYEVAETLKTLAAAPTTVNYKRFDIITLKVSEDALTANINVITGEEGLNPVIPTVPNADTEIVITTVSISANATEPDGVSNILLYDELVGEPTEWTVTENSSGSGISLNNTEHPNTNSLNIKVNYALLNTSDAITMSSSQDYSIDDISTLDFYVYIGTEISAIADTPEPYISIKLYDNLSQMGTEVRVRDGEYGLDTAILEAYQLISIPIAQFNSFSGFADLPQLLLNKIVFGFSGDIGTEVFLDTFKLTSGVIIAPTEPTYKALQDTLDNDFIGKEGYTPIVRGDNLKLEKAVESTDIWGANGKIDGGVVYTGTGLDYYVWASAYIVDNIRYDIYISGVVTLDIGDANPRFDVFAIEMSAGVPSIVVVKGDPSVNPLEPSLELSEQVKIGLVLVEALATEDTSTITGTVYDENVEWTNDVASAGVVLTDNDPYSGATNIFVPKSTAGDINVGWTNGSTLPYNSDTHITFAIKNISLWTKLSGMRIYIKNGGTIIGMAKFTASTLSKYGFVDIINSYFLISMPITELNINAGSILGSMYDGIEFSFTQADSFRLDLITFQGGIIEPPSSTACCEMDIIADCGTVINLTNQRGRLANMGSANTTLVYTTTGTKAGSWQKTLIQTASEPTITGATKIVGSDFVGAVDMYLVVTHNGVRVEYWFEEISGIIPT